MNNLESVLAGELRPVAAPAELRERVERPRPRQTRAAVSRWWWAVAAAAMLAIASAWGLRPGGEIRSSDAAEIRGWVLAKTGLDVPLPAAAPVRLAGARVLNGGKAAKIAYRVSGFEAALLVSRAEAVHTVIGAGRAVCPVSKGQVYVLECSSPEGLQVACRLCHG